MILRRWEIRALRRLSDDVVYRRRYWLHSSAERHLARLNPGGRMGAPLWEAIGVSGGLEFVLVDRLADERGGADPTALANV
jgi:hypothetical protein